MGDVTKGIDKNDGQVLSGDDLDKLVDLATINPSFVTGKTELVTPAGTEFFNVVDGTGLYKKVQLANIPGATVANPSYTILTPGSAVTQTCVGGRTTQNAKLLIGNNPTALTISGATNGMFGVILVTQGGGGNNVLTLPATSYGLGQTGAITQADLSITGGVTTACAWTYDGSAYYWTFAKYAVASPFCRAALSAAQPLTSGVVAVVSYASETFDNDTMHSNTVNPTRIIVQRPGIYLAQLYLAFASNSTGERYGSIAVNGASVASDRRTATTTGDITLPACYPCNYLDYFEASAMQSSGGALNLTASVFTVARIGAF